MELFVTKANGWKLSTVLDVAGVLDQPSGGVIWICCYGALGTNINVWLNPNKPEDKNGIYVSHISCFKDTNK